jgi:hypothetical protein
MQYIVGANCFAPKIYCIEFAVKENRLEKKKANFFRRFFF